MPGPRSYPEPSLLPQADPASDLSLSGEQSGADTLFSIFERGYPVLSALSATLSPDELLVIAMDSVGFPLVQHRYRRPEKLPLGIVIGRHARCNLCVDGDEQLSLRHLLLTLWPGSGQMRIRGYDLGSRSGIVLADGRRVPGFSASQQLATKIGSSALFVLPGGPAGRALFAGDEGQSYQRLTGLDPQRDKESSYSLAAVMEPGIALLSPEQEAIGGYRPRALPSQDFSQGRLVLRPHSGGAPGRELEIDSAQLERGLLIGRYSSRCSLTVKGPRLSRVHALVTRESPDSLLVYDLASTNGTRPADDPRGPTHSVLRLTADRPCLLGHFELSWIPGLDSSLH